MRKLLLLALTLLLLTLPAVTRASGDDYTPRQYQVIALAYEYMDFYGFRAQDYDLFLRVLWRESHFGADKTGDCNANGYCFSIGTPMFHEAGVWWSTPCASMGLAARNNDDAAVGCAAWAWNRGMSSHWRPWEFTLTNYLSPVPADPRPVLWGQAHNPNR